MTPDMKALWAMNETLHRTVERLLRDQSQRRAGRLRGERIIPIPVPGEIHRAEEAMASAARHHCVPWELWGPRLAGLMGLASGEIAMLAKEALVMHQGRWFLRIEYGASGPLPAESPRHRCLPIPASLEVNGLVAFIHSAPPGLLFPELSATPSRDGQLRAWVTRAAAVDEPQKGVRMTLQDLRRACAQSLRISGADPWTMQAFLGRSASSSLARTMGYYRPWGDPSELLAMIDTATLPAIR